MFEMSNKVGCFQTYFIEFKDDLDDDDKHLVKKFLYAPKKIEF